MGLLTVSLYEVIEHIGYLVETLMERIFYIAEKDMYNAACMAVKFPTYPHSYTKYSCTWSGAGD